MTTFSLAFPTPRDQDYIALTIAGSDPSGGAGIQADLKTFAANGCYGASVITALTAQNTTGVRGVFPVASDFVEEQIFSVCDDLKVNAIKTGMLYDENTVRAVVWALNERFKKNSSKSSLPPLVCDPVCVSTSGHVLLQEDALRTLTQDLFPIATLVTPNKSETELLLHAPWTADALENRHTQRHIRSLEDMFNASTVLFSKFQLRAVLLKGGHLTTNMEEINQLLQLHPSTKLVLQNGYHENMEILQVNDPNSYNRGDMVLDLLCRKDGRNTIFARAKIETLSTHGTGCTLSSAIASELAKGLDLEEAVANATVYTNFGIQYARPIGNGNGPLNHFHDTGKISVPKRAPTNPYPFTQLLIKSAARDWKAYVEHDFVKELGKGTLPRECFIHFIRQDYLYLKYYARAYGLLIAKTNSFVAFESSCQTIMNVLHEVGNHIDLCAKYGISEEELEQTQEETATTGYGAYMMDVGMRGDPTKLVIALLACLLGYGEVGLWLKNEASKPNSWVVLEGNPYRYWMDGYAGEMYQTAVRIGLETVEQCAEADPPSQSRLAEWKEVWRRCTRLEKGFWDMAMSARKATV